MGMKKKAAMKAMKVMKKKAAMKAMKVMKKKAAMKAMKVMKKKAAMKAMKAMKKCRQARMQGGLLCFAACECHCAGGTSHMFKTKDLHFLFGFVHYSWHLNK